MPPPSTLPIIQSGEKCFEYPVSSADNGHFNLHSAGIDFSRQSLDVRFLQPDPRAVRIKIFVMVVDLNIDIQMNQEELTKIFMVVSK